MKEMRVFGDESIERALKRFKKIVEKSGVLTEVAKRKHYEKPSQKRNRKKAEARSRAAKARKKQYTQFDLAKI